METSSSYGSVLPPTWGEVWIVAGGPSALPFLDNGRDFWLGKTVLAVNEAALPLGSLATAVFSVDHRWVRRRREFLTTFQGEKYLTLPLETWPDCAGISGATYLQQAYLSGLSEDDRFIRTGGNSGYGALNLAYLKKAWRIYLLGYDMLPVTQDEFLQWIPRFRSTVTQLQIAGVSVYNLNPDSGIDAFPRVSYTDLFKRGD